MATGKFLVATVAVIALVADLIELTGVIHGHLMSASLQVSYIAQTMLFIVIIMFLLARKKRQ